MKFFTVISLLLLLLLQNFVHPQQIPPKREFRAVWIASVSNIDWPSSKYLSAASQRSEFISVLDKNKLSGMNAVIVQIRPSCDAFYSSSIEPWSEWLTGTQGSPPNPLYDPLTFMIEETHKRGMEFHAWFNPYRSVVGSSSSVSNSHVSKTHPEWNLRFSTPYKLLDPGIPEVRNYVVSIIMDVVRRYDIDGVHFDDYFYPYEGIVNQDSISWGNYSRGFTNRADWRRDNVNLLVRMVYDSIAAVKPWVKFGISPFGIWKSGVPAGISGLSAYNDIYCDAVYWLNQRIVDYITPQLYWQFGGGQDYGKLMPWWSTQLNGRHLYTGNAAYKMDASDANRNWPASELMQQIRANRANSQALGHVFFSSKWITNNYKGIQDSLRNDLYKYSALLPAMPWKDNIPPLPPQNLTALLESNKITLQWEKPAAAIDGNIPKYFVVYKFTHASPIDIDDSRNIKYITVNDTNKYTDFFTVDSQTVYTYAVTSVDRLHNESTSYASVQVGGTAIPVELISFDAQVENRIVKLKWVTASEKNNRGFEVERKVNVDWEPVGFVSGSGTTAQLSAYSFEDDISLVKVEKEVTYRLCQIDFDGAFKYSNSVSVAVHRLLVVNPKHYGLEQNYPNPFNPITLIKFTLPADNHVSLRVYDVLGKEIQELVNSNLPAGSHQITFNADGLTSGTYIYRLLGEGFVDSKKMILLR